MTGARTVPVIAAPMLDPGAGRIDLELPCEMTIAQMVSFALPGLPEMARRRVRVTLVTDRGSQTVDPGVWHLARARPGVRVVMRVVPGDEGLRSVLTIVVAVAAVALGGYFSPMLAGTFGLSEAVWNGLIILGTTALGNALITSLIPPVEPDKTPARYNISGFRNEMRPDGAVPEIMGSLRYAPPFAASSWSEIVGDLQYIRTAFHFGTGSVELSDLRFGDTSIDDYDEVETEILTGVPGTTAMDLYPWQIVEERVGSELVRPWPTDDEGEIIDGPSVETPIIRSTGRDAAAVSLIFWFPQGLIRFNREGDKRDNDVGVRIRQRQLDSDPWQDVTHLVFLARKTEAFFRQYTWNLPSRGRWKIEVTLTNDPPGNERYLETCVLAAVQTIRTEPPIADVEPVTLVAMRAKATHQFNGQIDNFNALASRLGLDWDHEAEEWVTRATSNPASYFRLALQSPANPRPVSDAEIDLELLQDWHDFCRIKDLKFDHVFEEDGMSLRDALTVIAAAGRAAPRHDGTRWGVVIDRPQSLVIDHINPRNAEAFRTTRSYFEPPHGFRVQFRDATDDYREAERIVRWPGYEGPISLTEELVLTGKTDPDEIAREATRRAYELLHRTEVHEVTQEHGVRVATTGDLVMMSNDILSAVQWAGRVTAVEGRMVVLDEQVTMEAGEAYALRFRHLPDPEIDTIGQSVLRSVQTVAGETATLLLTGDGPAPVVGALVHFGPAAEESMPVLIQGIEAGEEFSSIVRMVDAAPIVDELTDAYVPPPWTGRTGESVDYVAPAPAAPYFTSIRSGLEPEFSIGTGSGDEWADPDPDPEPRDITVLLAPGTGSSALLVSYQIEHRVVGAPDWTILTVPVSAGGATITGYETEQLVELRAKAVAVGGTEGPYSATISITVGANDPAIPAALAEDAVTVTGGLGYAQFAIVMGSDPVTTGLRLYRVPVGEVLDRETHGVGGVTPTTPGAVFNLFDGDATRSNLLSNSVFDTAGAWTPEAGWAVTGGKAAHVAGTADTIRQSLTLTAGRSYRIAFTAAITAGSVTPKLFGGTDVPGAAVTTSGPKRERLTALSGNTAFGWAASSDGDLQVDDAVLFLETAGCLPAGAFSWYVEPVSALSVAGPLAGPFDAEVL
jgi:hypothetical protein